jgi:hypothetical protein
MYRDSPPRPGDARELRFVHIGGLPVILAVDGDGRKRALDGVTAAPAEPTLAAIEAHARATVRCGVLVGSQTLTEYDSYSYATGDPRRDARPLPASCRLYPCA